MRILIAIPIYNEVKHVSGVLDEVRRYASDILVVDDGSTDGSSQILDNEVGLFRETHAKNRGYGAAISTAFDFTIRHGYDVLVTMDCDGQHQPDRIPVLLERIGNADIVSGSRYLRDFRQNTPAPTDRRFINAQITGELNEKFGLNITDAFCGFKAYRRHALEQLKVTETGWGMPLQVWVEAAKLGLRITEIGVPRLYIDPNRTFGAMNDPTERLNYYHNVIEAADCIPLGNDYRVCSCGVKLYHHAPEASMPLENVHRFCSEMV